MQTSAQKEIIKNQGTFGKILAFDWLVLLILAPVFILMQPHQTWILLIFPVFWLLNFIAKKNPIPSTPMNLCLLVIAIQVLVSLYATYDIAVSYQKVVGVLWGMSVFFALVKLGKNFKGIILSTVIFILGGTGISILGLLGIEWPLNKIIIFNTLYEEFPRISSILPGLTDGFHPNEVGGALTWILPFWLVVFVWMIFRFGKIKKTIAPIWIILTIFLFVVLSGLSSVVLLFSQSRSAYIGIFIGIVLLLLVVLPKTLRWGYVFLLMIGAGFLIYFIVNGQFMQFFNQLFPDSGMASMAFSMNTLSGRVEIWARAIYAMQDFAFTGMGMNTFRTIVNVLYPLQTISADVPVRDIGHAHNLFLQVGLDLGIPGLIGFIGIYLTSFWMIAGSIRWLKRPSKNREDRKNNLAREILLVIVFGLMGGQIAHLGFSITDAIAFGAKPGILFWVMQSIICAIYLHTRNRDDREYGISKDY